MFFDSLDFFVVSYCRLQLWLIWVLLKDADIQKFVRSKGGVRVCKKRQYVRQCVILWCKFIQKIIKRSFRISSFFLCYHTVVSLLLWQSEPSKWDCSINVFATCYITSKPYFKQSVCTSKLHDDQASVTYF